MENPNLRATLLDSMGSDARVVDAARVSFAKECKNFDERDARLIRYLARHGHWTPFAHCVASFRVRAPIFVARQLGKHQIGLVWSEVSRRYVDSTPECYLPDEIRARPDGSVKQGSGGRHANQDLRADINWHHSAAIRFYEHLIAAGVAPEQARMVLPQSAVTEWIWTGSLAAWARVYALRIDAHAQQETQEIARQIGEQVREHFPVSWAALTEAA